MILEFDDTEGLSITKKQTRKMLIDHYDSEIMFCKSERKNESDLCYSSSLSLDELAKVLCYRDLCHEAGIILREAFDLIDFMLDDKFCDADELKQSWLNTPMPGCYLGKLHYLRDGRGTGGSGRGGKS